MRRPLLLALAAAMASFGWSPPTQAAPSAEPQIAAGDRHTCALVNDGTVKCWGYNHYGQLGTATNNGTGNPNPTPVTVPGITGATQIAAGNEHTCALLAGGTVKCWGYNQDGELGNPTNSGTTTPNPTPLSVSGISGATGIAAGGFHTCALLAGGTAKCWGDNNYGQLGSTVNNGSNNPNPTPLTVTGLTGATEIDGGGVYTCALVAGGAAKCWGHNFYGQLGNPTNSGTGNPNPTPLTVSGTAGATQIAGGSYHTCATLAGGTSTCWGYNLYGQLGHAINVGTSNPNPTPTYVSGIATATRVAAGGYHSCALLAGGGVSCWGRNRYGQAGNTTNNGNDNPNPNPGTVAGLDLEPNALPYGRMILSLTDGRGYGMLAWAIDPETGGPVRMRVVIPGVLSNEYDWNYTWHDMPAYTGVNRTESLVFLAQLPPGTHTICFDALDPQGAGWTRLDCRTHTVK